MNEQKSLIRKMVDEFLETVYNALNLELGFERICKHIRSKDANKRIILHGRKCRNGGENEGSVN